LVRRKTQRQLIVLRPPDSVTASAATGAVFDLFTAILLTGATFSGRLGMGGPHVVDPKNPAALERRSAAQAREWARVAMGWPRTAAMLNSMAENWERLADHLEERGQQDAMRDE